MATNVSQIKYQGTRKGRHMPAVPSITSKVRRAMRRVIRLLSFDADNIFKSKEWPYY